MLMTVRNNTLQKTLSELERLSIQYSSDVKNIKDVDIITFYDIVSKKIKYVPDPVNAELLCRPAITLKKGCGDCDDKTILCLAYFIENKIKCGYSIVSERPDKEYHHIFPFIVLSGKVYDFDATYNTSKLGVTKNNFTARLDKIIYNGELRK